MNKIVLFVVTVFCLPALGQKISFEQNGIYGKDSLEQRKMEFGVFDLRGKDHTWSLEGIKADKKEYRSRFLEKRNGLESWTWTNQY